MKKSILLLLLLSNYAQALTCKQAEDMAEYLRMDAAAFKKKYRDHKLAGHKDEPSIKLDDVNQARKVAYKLPALEDFGFTPVNSKDWKPLTVRMESSSLYGMKSGRTMTNAKGEIATIRIDYDPEKGAHYNISVMTKSGKGKESFKAAIKFDCNGRPCTKEEVVKLAKSLQ